MHKSKDESTSQETMEQKLNHKNTDQQSHSGQPKSSSRIYFAGLKCDCNARTTHSDHIFCILEYVLLNTQCSSYRQTL